jgi:prephenate dehydratase
VRVAYPGAPGAFAHEACLAFLPRYSPEARDGFAEVAQAVARGAAERGILPLANSRAGPVPGAAEAIARHELDIVAEHVLPVRMHLLALPGVALADLRIAISHPVALCQCAAGIRSLGLVTQEASNTAVAARDLRARDMAVLASEAAAKTYGLAILVRDIHDDPANATRFAVIARRPAEPSART